MLKKSLGFSLVEVLISLFIFSLILLGFDAMELIALRESRSAYYFSMAAMQVQSMAEKLHAVGEVSDWIESWNQQNQEMLPHGKGEVIGAYPIYEIILHW